MAARVPSPKTPSASIGAPLLRMAVSRRWMSETAVPVVPEGEREAYRYAAISWSS